VICIVVLGIVALLLLRPALLRLIDRTSKAGKRWLWSFERPQEGEKPQPPLLPFDELMKLPITSSVLSREKTLNGNLDSLNLSEDKQKIALLIRALSNFQVLCRIYQNIWNNLW